MCYFLARLFKLNTTIVLIPYSRTFNIKIRIFLFLAISFFSAIMVNDFYVQVRQKCGLKHGGR